MAIDGRPEDNNQQTQPDETSEHIEAALANFRLAIREYLRRRRWQWLRNILGLRPESKDQYDA